MTENPTPVSPPPPPVAPKKGLSPIAWVAIGCGALLIIALVVFAVGGMFVAGKAKEAMKDFEDNPALAAAKLAIRANPDLELVESDTEEGTLTVRDKTTGETFTVDLEDIEQGKVSFESGGEKGTVTFGGEGEEGHVTVTGSEGETTFRAGAGSGEDVPDWVPRYPGSEPAGAFSMVSGETVNGSFSVTTDDTVEAVASHFESELSSAGYEVSKTTFSGPEGESMMLQGTSEGDHRQITVMISRDEGKTQAVVSYAQQQP